MRDGSTWVMTCALLGVLAAQNARAQETIGSPFADYFRLSAGLLSASAETEMRLDADDGTLGTVVSGEDDLGLRDKSEMGDVEMEIRIRERHRLRHVVAEDDVREIGVRAAHDVEQPEVQPGARGGCARQHEELGEAPLGLRRFKERKRAEQPRKLPPADPLAQQRLQRQRAPQHRQRQHADHQQRRLSERLPEGVLQPRPARRRRQQREHHDAGGGARQAGHDEGADRGPRGSEARDCALAPSLYSGGSKVSPFSKPSFEHSFAIISFLLVPRAVFGPDFRFPAEYWLDGIDLWLSRYLWSRGIEIREVPIAVAHRLSVADEFRRRLSVRTKD